MRLTTRLFLLMLMAFSALGQVPAPNPVPSPTPVVLPAPEASAAVLTQEVVVPMAGSEVPPVDKSSWPEEPDGFAGQKFGTAKSLMPTNMTIACSGRKPKTPADPVLVCKNDSYSVTTTIRVEARFEYAGSIANPRFSGVELQVSNKNIGKVKDVMISKYGRPMDTDNDDKLTRGQAIGVALFGGPTTNPKKVSEWLGDRVKIVLTETEQAFGRSTISIRLTDTIKAEAEKSVF